MVTLDEANRNFELKTMHLHHNLRVLEVPKHHTISRFIADGYLLLNLDRKIQVTLAAKDERVLLVLLTLQRILTFLITGSP